MKGNAMIMRIRVLNSKEIGPDFKKCETQMMFQIELIL